MKRLQSKLWAKLTALPLFGVFVLLAFWSGVGTAVLVAEGGYSAPKSFVARQAWSGTEEAYWLGKLVSARYVLPAACLASLAVCLVLFVFLLCSAGHSEAEEGVHLSWFDRIPLDLFLAAMIFAQLICGYLTFQGLSGTLMTAALVSLGIYAISFLAMLTLMSLAARMKTPGFLKNSVSYFVLHGLWRVLRWLFRGIGSISVCRRAGVVWLGWCTAELLVLAALWTPGVIAWWALSRLLLTPVVFYFAAGLKTLQTGAHALADGDLAYEIRRLPGWLPALRRCGEDLNSIKEGMQKAVAEQTKAERLRTELITNVSHDIKTPLTSIVNYVDLLKKKPMPDAQAEEYLAVLDRQSARLKKLTEDLVEASKASTGNLSVALAPTDVNVLLSQVAGEYLDRLEAAGLDVVFKPEPSQPQIPADGRLLWRVLENLLSNILKYAQPGTRVYFQTQQTDTQVRIIFKNVSRYELNISADELMERFVRGDRSRNTEGSGLGLSIAQSLTKLQGGTFLLDVDGDLFKATLVFPRLPEDSAE